jgi:DNA-binding XRE family transcriptional regulator
MNLFETDWYKKTKAKTIPGDNLKIYRENKSLTQAKLGELLGGIPRQHISNMETGTRTISIKIAHKLSEIFNVSVEKFI